MMDIKRHQPEIGFFVLVATLFLLWFLGRFFNLDTPSLQSALARFPLSLRGVTYIALYVAVTFFVFFSKDFFWLAGAVLFGAGTSTLLISISEVINAFILFFLARFLGRAYVDRELSNRYRKLDERLSGLPFFWLFLMRAVPLIPYRFLDLAAGLTKIRFRRYLAACILGTPLKTFWLQSILVSVGDNIYKNPSAVVEYFLDHQALLFLSFLYILGVILVALRMVRQG